MMNQHTRRILAIGLSLLFLACAVASHAVPRVQVQGRDVFVAGSVVFRGSSTTQAETVTQRISNALDMGASAGSVAIKGQRRNYSVWMSGQLISSYEGRPAKSMAMSFAAKLKRAAAQPAVKMPAPGMVVPFGDSRTITVSGYGVSDSEMSVMQSDMAPVVDAKFDRTTKKLTIKSLNIGETTVVLAGPDGEDRLAIKVRPWAGHVGYGGTVGVMGSVVSASLIKRAVTSAIYRHTSRQPQAVVNIKYLTPMNRSLHEGKKLTVTAKVNITAPNSLPVNYTANIPVRNLSILSARETVLRVSNNPETVKSVGRLFEGTVLPGRSTRLLYHHLNETGRTTWIRVELSNPSDRPRTLQLIGATPAARIDPLQLGAVAGKEFLSRLFGQQGMVITIRPRSKMNLFTQRVPNKLSSSGVIQMTMGSDIDTPCGLRVSLDGRPPVDSATELLAASLPQDISVMDGTIYEKDSVYETSHKSIKASYEVGKAWQFIRIGEHAVVDKHGNKLFGNYGVVYSVDIDMYNPSDVMKKVRVSLEPSGGLADAAFAIGGDMVQLGVLQPNRDYTVKILVLQPGQRRQIKIHTMPLAGSNYPVTLVVGS